MKSIAIFGFCFLMLASLMSPAQAQELSFFFAAGDLSGEPDRFGNTHTVSPEDAILDIPFGDDALLDVFIDEDNQWLIWRLAGNNMLVSHGPGFNEDAPELTMEITVALAGRYEVVLRYLENRALPGSAPILAATGTNELQMFSAVDGRSVEATGGTGQGFPQFGNVLQGDAFFYHVSLGEVELEAGESVTVRVDDVQGNTLEQLPPIEAATVFQGVTLNVLELTGEGGISEIQVSPGAIGLDEFTTDVSGNQFRIWPDDEAAFPTQEDWLTVNDRQDGSGLWNTRENLGPFGPVLESFPTNGNDAMPLRTTVIFAQGGRYNVFLNIGDTEDSTPSQNFDIPNPALFAFAGEELETFIPDDGTFKGTPGYNDYEIPVGVVDVEDGEARAFLFDDAVDFEGVNRSVYLGMRFELINDTGINEIQVSPGAHEWTRDLSGNLFRTLTADLSFNLEDWLSIDADDQTGDNLWNKREGLGPFGPVLESRPNSGEDSPTLQTQVLFAQGGTYDVFLNIGDTAAADPAENEANPNPLLFAMEGEAFTTFVPNDGEFISTPGFNDFEISLGQITVESGEKRTFLIDDAIDFENVQRSVYLGMRFVLTSDTAVKSWSLY